MARPEVIEDRISSSSVSPLWVSLSWTMRISKFMIYFLMYGLSIMNLPYMRCKMVLR